MGEELFCGFDAVVDEILPQGGSCVFQHEPIDIVGMIAYDSAEFLVCDAFMIVVLDVLKYDIELVQ